MGFGVGILLLVIGLILTLDAITLPSSITDHVDADVIGWICIIVGALAIVLVLITNQQRSKTTHIEERREQ